jgi:dynein heavy chain, axonemal
VKRFDSYKHVNKNATDALALKERFEKAVEKVRSFNERESLFKLPISDNDELTKLMNLFEPYHKLWDLCMEFDLNKQDWYLGSFTKLRYPPVERKVN